MKKLGVSFVGSADTRSVAGWVNPSESHKQRLDSFFWTHHVPQQKKPLFQIRKADYDKLQTLLAKFDDRARDAAELAAKPPTVQPAIVQALSRVELPKQVPGQQGNVHTGAPPPWLTPDEIQDYEVSRKSGAKFKPTRDRRGNAKRQRSGPGPHAIAAERKQKSSHEAEVWLPKFGRVFNDGPQSETRKEFLREMQEQANDSG
eukprot:c15776_g1_i1.p2 GENE.c15776_g1_i1~~c15776_g1_i1.p2  ORF type:complete len:203 (-),score=34.92 c15776_g1_i1:59-667(-)